MAAAQGTIPSHPIPFAATIAINLLPSLPSVDIHGTKHRTRTSPAGHLNTFLRPSRKLDSTSNDVEFLLSVSWQPLKNAHDLCLTASCSEISD
ncbi:hypothetical protein Cob_v000654 [Colletotrichum orbiculare MAFF 240422]|uniref:Uncharacterized protein n=1 Tax=Colletotrichum orbiculare (strain 104-T / ATCC 96160 / CBS 514.97 / LARS 414 / MAFF 240422) TaxID=1213857 RepID=A0A484G924_COLOR|nr:hypothetical protein Cob_v000654 [Colletotrichum orbiculare MAFF 240422]